MLALQFTALWTDCYGLELASSRGSPAHVNMVALMKLRLTSREVEAVCLEHKQGQMRCCCSVINNDFHESNWLELKQVMFCISSSLYGCHGANRQEQAGWRSHQAQSVFKPFVLEDTVEGTGTVNVTVLPRSGREPSLPPGGAG